MSKTTCMILIAMCAASAAFAKDRERDVIVDVRPGTLLLASKSGDFEVVGPGPVGEFERQVEEANDISSIPNVRLGLGWSTPESYLDLTAGVGMLVNSYFRSLTLGADASYQVRVKKNVAVGPHVGLMYFTDPEWRGDAPLDIDPTLNYLLGMEVAIGYDVLFIFSVDYLMGDAMDVALDESSGWVNTDDDDLDITGLSIQFGIRGRL